MEHQQFSEKASFQFAFPPAPFSLIFYLFIFREGKGGKKRGRETSRCGCLLHTPYWGPGLQPRHVPQTGNQNKDPLVHRQAPSPLSHTSQGPTYPFAITLLLHYKRWACLSQTLFLLQCTAQSVKYPRVTNKMTT